MKPNEVVYRSPHYDPSVDLGVNFYYERSDLAISDNHRMAFYFFAKNVVHGSQLFHSDTHEDFWFFRDYESTKHLKADWLAQHKAFIESAAVKWGNWIPALVEFCPKFFDRVYLCCHRSSGVPKDYFGTEISRLSDDEFFGFQPSTKPTCFSLDLDYYFKTDKDVLVLRHELKKCIRHMEKTLDHFEKWANRRVFIAISPSCCGNLEDVSPFFDTLDQRFGLNLSKEDSLTRCFETSG